MRKQTYVPLLLVVICLVAATLAFSYPSPAQENNVLGAEASTAQEEAGGTQAQVDAGGTQTPDNPWYLSSLNVLGWFAVPLVALVAFRIYRLYQLTNRNSQLIVTDFKNSSGSDEFDNRVVGLSQLAREKLAADMKALLHEVKRQLRGDFELLERAPLPTSVQDSRLNDLLTNLAENVPEQIRPVVQLVGILSSPQGIRVNSHLQFIGDTPGKAAISYEISDIEGQQEPKLFTLWEQSTNEVSLSTSLEPPSGDNSNEEAQALFALGQLYQERGALEQAKAMYEEALKKQHAAEVAEVMEHVLLSNKRTLSQRYVALVEPGALWLAIELSRRIFLQDISRHYRNVDLDRRRRGSPPLSAAEREDGVKRDAASIYNFLAAYCVFKASTHGLAYEQTFYDQARGYLERALELAPNWYLPYENLGDLYSYTDEHLLAIHNYDKALGLIPNTRFKVPKPTSYIGNIPQEDLVRCRIRIAKGIAQMHLGGNAREEARGAIGDIARDCTDVRLSTPLILYDLACWYAADAKVSPEPSDAMTKARLYLVASLARDGRTGMLWEWSDNDPDLRNIRSGLEKLKSGLDERLRRPPDLLRLSSEAFWREVETLLAQAQLP